MHSVFDFKNFIDRDGIEAGIIIIHRIFQSTVNGFRHIQNKLGKLLVAGETDRYTGIQLFKEAHCRSDHVLVVLGAVQNTVHEKALALKLTRQDFEGHGQHGAIRIGLGAFDLHVFQLHFILASGNGGKISAAVLFGILHIGLKALQINRTINLVKINSHSFLPPKMLLCSNGFENISQPMKQAVHKFSSFLGPVHSVNFFFCRGKFLIKGKQIIRQNPIQQILQRRVYHRVIEIIMLGSIANNCHFRRAFVKPNHGFRASIRGRRHVHTQLDLAEQATTIHFIFESVQSIFFHIASPSHLVRNDFFNLTG
nr:MAG TPA: hypothetical protein [Caudoviricetes sp.]